MRSDGEDINGVSPTGIVALPVYLPVTKAPKLHLVVASGDTAFRRRAISLTGGRCGRGEVGPEPAVLSQSMASLSRFLSSKRTRSIYGAISSYRCLETSLSCPPR